jgi:hypothetical protein
MSTSGIRTCIFCERTPLTKEHVVGDWAGRFADAEQRSIVHLSDREGEAREIREWNAKAYDRQARIVCAACNNGWMSNLETRASALLVPGELDGRTLRQDEQALLATWAMKTALVLNAAESRLRRAIPSEVAIDFGHDRRVPVNTEMWISSYAGDDDQLPALVGLGIDLDNRQDSSRGWRDLAVTTFLVGLFVFQVFFAVPRLGITRLTRDFPPHTPHLEAVADHGAGRMAPPTGTQPR